MLPLMFLSVIVAFHEPPQASQADWCETWEQRSAEIDGAVILKRSDGRPSEVESLPQAIEEADRRARENRSGLERKASEYFDVVEVIRPVTIGTRTLQEGDRMLPERISWYRCPSEEDQSDFVLIITGEDLLLFPVELDSQNPREMLN